MAFESRKISVDALSRIQIEQTNANE